MTMITEDPEFLRAVLRDLMRDIVGMRASGMPEPDRDTFQPHHSGHAAGTGPAPGLHCLIEMLASLAGQEPGTAAP